MLNLQGLVSGESDLVGSLGRPIPCAQYNRVRMSKLSSSSLINTSSPLPFVLQYNDIRVLPEIPEILSREIST
jgi:hypothetical protein